MNTHLLIIYIRKLTVFFILIVLSHIAWAQLPFITTWSTNDGEITIPTVGSETYNYDISWTNLTNPGTNEGSASGQAGNYTITGLENGSIYQLEISGDFPRIYFNNKGDKDKILTIEQWGNIAWTSMQRAFFGCSNLTVPATDAPDLSGVTDISVMFAEASSFDQNIGDWDVGNVTNMVAIFQDASLFNQDINGWNVSNVTDMSWMFFGASSFNQDISGWEIGEVNNMEGMFWNATSFNQDIGDWEVSNVANMSNMLDNSGLSNANYDAILAGWAAQTLQSNVTLGADGLMYCDGTAARSILSSAPNNWTITGDTKDCPFITTWSTNNGQLTIPTFPDETYNYDVSWTNLTNPGTNEGSESGQTGNYTITGLENGSIYQVEISGDFPHIYFNDAGDKEKILTVEQWGDIAWTSMSRAFQGCSNLTIPATDAPNLSGVSNIANMFNGASSFNQDISGWDVSSVTGNGMISVFNGATSFNQPLGDWNVSNVTEMSTMFNGATSFNQDISGWDVSNVTNMAGMFTHASSFNQDISGWDVSNVFNMNNLFAHATSFDRNIGSWDLSNILSMNGMLGNSGLSTDNYGNTLIGWLTLDEDAGETQIPIGINLAAHGLTYACSSDAENARSLLLSDFGWTITGDASIDLEDPVPNLSSLEELTAVCSLETPTAPTATDNCDGEITGTTDIEFPITEQGTTVITWIFKDESGNETVQQQLVNISDTESPEPNLNELPIIYTNCNGTIEAMDVPTATDNCVGVIEGTTNQTFPFTASLDTTQIVWEFDDGNGNTNIQFQSVVKLLNVDVDLEISLCEDAEFTFPDGSAWDFESTTQISSLTTQFGCDSIITTTITVLPLPQVDLGMDVLYACRGQELAFGIDEENTDFASYTISTILGISSADDSLKFVFDDTMAATATLNNLYVIIEAVSTDGCVGRDTVLIKDNTMVNWGIGSVQNNDPQIIIASTHLPETADSFIWDFGDENTNDTDVNPTHTYTENGTYTISLTAINECMEETLTTDVTISGVCPELDNTVSLSGNTLTANTDNLTYQWLDCWNGHAPIAEATGQSFTPTETGSYAVEIRDGNCSIISDCIEVDIVLSVQDTEDDWGVKLYPNPVNDNLIIDIANDAGFKLQILDINGTQLLTKQLDSQQTSIDMSRYPQGIYFIRLNNQEKVFVRKIIKN